MVGHGGTVSHDQGRTRFSLLNLGSPSGHGANSRVIRHIDTSSEPNTRRGQGCLFRMSNGHGDLPQSTVTKIPASGVTIMWGHVSQLLFGSLDFSFLVEIKVFSTKPPKSGKLFAGGSLQPPQGLGSNQMVPMPGDVLPSTSWIGIFRSRRVGVAQISRAEKVGLGALLPVFGWEGSPTTIDYRKRGTLILTSLLEDLWEC